MLDRDGGSALGLFRAILEAPHGATVADGIETLVLQLGYGGFAFGLLWGDPMRPEGVATLIGGNMVAFANEYFERDFAGADPIVRRLRTSAEPIPWSPYIAEPRLGGPDSRMADIAACLLKHGINAGVSLPAQIEAVGCRAGLSVAAVSGDSAESFDARFAENGWMLRLLAIVLAQVLGRTAAMAEAGTLSSSERLVLVALGQGLRPRDIAERLGKSEHTIRNQIVSAQQRLGARTKEEAIAKALRFGLIHL